MSSIAATTSGNFLVVWRDFRDNGDFGQQTGYGRVFDGSGNPLTNDFRLFQNTPAGLGTGDPAVTSDPSGRFIVGASDARDGGRYLRHLNGIGQFMDVETRIDNGAGSGLGLYLAPVGTQKVFTAWGDSRVASGQIWGNITGPDPNLTPTVSTTVLAFLRTYADGFNRP